MKYLFLILITIFSANADGVNLYLPANIVLGNSTDSITYTKVDAALNLAIKAADKRYVSLIIRDSIANEKLQVGIQPKLNEIAREVGANNLVFVKIDIFENMMRCDMAIANSDTSIALKTGRGYAILNFREVENDKPLYDPTLLACIQRAFANTLNDSLMYNKLKGALRVFPAEPLIIGGAIFEDMPSHEQWDLFKAKEVYSYDLCETIYETMNRYPGFVVYDIPTRDSIFAKFGLYMIENFSTPSEFELNALEQFEVQWYLSGKLKRNDEGAILELYLGKIKNGKFTIHFKSLVKVEKGSTDKFRHKVKEATLLLLKDYEESFRDDKKSKK